METQASSPGLNLQSTTGSVSVNIADETRRTLTYDANGSTATDSLGRTYEWDRENRLKAIAYSGPGNKRTEFSYDSSSRWNRIVERDNGVITSDKRFLWDGFKIAEERDASGNVTKRYYPEGLQDVTASQNSFFALDHLGSVRTITDAAGALQTHLQFDPWGRRNESPFNGAHVGFTGHYHYKHRDEVPGNNVSDGLELAPFRAYEGSLARWKSRDPIEENGGLNLYAYVENAPGDHFDILGLAKEAACLRRCEDELMKCYSNQNIAGAAAGGYVIGAGGQFLNKAGGTLIGPLVKSGGLAGGGASGSATSLTRGLTHLAGFSATGRNATLIGQTGRYLGRLGSAGAGVIVSGTSLLGLHADCLASYLGCRSGCPDECP